MASHSRHVLHDLRDRISKDPERFSRSVYSRLFSLSPELRDLFPATMTHQRDIFHRVVDHVLDVVPSPSGHSELVEFLAQLGRDHRKYGVTPEHYWIMQRVLIDEFRTIMGDVWDPDTEQTVTQATMLLTGVMRGAAQTATTPARWTATVAEKYRITRDLAVIRLVAQTPIGYKAGQYLEVQIPQWPHSWRNLSPAIPPNASGEIEFHVRAIQGGSVSTAIVSETRVGDVWSLSQAHGTLEVVQDRELLMIAGGSGLAPLRAILIQMSKRVANPQTHLFYGMRYPGELYDLPVLRRIASTNPWLTVTAVSEEDTDPWWINAVAAPGQLGVDHRIGKLTDVVAAQGDWSEHQALISGSASMIETTRRRLIIGGMRSSLIQHDPV